MDTLTHLVAGALTPLAFRHAPKSRLLIPFGIACGEFPDIDILAGTSPEALLVIHRGITHALAVQPFSALLLAAVFYPLLKKRDEAGSWTFGKTWLLAFLALLVHLFLDCMTTFGTQVFLPFSSYRVSIPAMYIIDLLLTLPTLGVLIMLLRRGGASALPEQRMRPARLALAWMLIYPFLALGTGQALQAHLNSRYARPAEANGIQRILLTPEPFAPLYWKVIAQKERSYGMSSVLLTSPDADRPFSEYERPDPALWRRLCDTLPLFAKYADFVSFPIQTTRQLPDGSTLAVFRDLRYEGTLPGLMKAIGRTDGLFLMEVTLDQAGTPLAYRFLRRGKLAAETPWTPMPAVPGKS